MAAVLAGEGRFAGDLASEFCISLHTYPCVRYLLIGMGLIRVKGL